MDQQDTINYFTDFMKMDLPTEEPYRIAIEALEKQIPKVISRTDMTKPYLCPSCNSRRFWRDGEYCTQCGQKLTWES